MSPSGKWKKYWMMQGIYENKYGKHQKENLVNNRQHKKGTSDNSRYTKYEKGNKKE